MSKALEVVKYPAEILRQKAMPVESFDDNLKQLAQDMFETMYSYKGIGLAANQVNQLKRLFVLDVAWREGSETEKKVEKSPQAFVNPEITLKNGEIEYEEGCLSIPKVYGMIQRSEVILVKYQDLAGVSHHEEFVGLKAIAFQHELDHLDGILFFDHLSAFKRRHLIEKFNKMQLELQKEDE